MRTTLFSQASRIVPNRHTFLAEEGQLSVGKGIATPPAVFWLKNLFFIAILLGISGQFLLWMLDPQTFPITELRIEGYVHTNPTEMSQHIADQLTGGFFHTDVRAVHTTIMTLPWVQQAQIKRLWPHTLLIRIWERQPIALWQPLGTEETHIIDTTGKLISLPLTDSFFQTQTAKMDSKLPVLKSTTDDLHETISYYQSVQPLLAEAGLQIREFGYHTLWYVILDNGVQLLLGRNNGVERIRYFAKAYDRIIAHFPLFLLNEQEKEKIQIDLRYTHGVAIRKRS